MKFPLIKWDPTNSITRKPGTCWKASTLDWPAIKCHIPDHIPAAERAAIKMKDLTKTFLGIPQACVTCHKDFHEGRLGQNCIQCHNFVTGKIPRENSTTVRRVIR